MHLVSRKRKKKTECAFLWVEPHVRPFEGLEDHYKVFDVLVTQIGLHHDVFHVDLHTLTDKTLEDLIHQLLVGCSNTLQIERHHLIVVVGVVHHEGRLLLIPRMHAYLVVARVSIHEIKDLMASRSIHQSVDVGKWIQILRVSYVKVCIIHAHSLLVVRFGDHDHIGQPCHVLGFTDEVGRQELLGFFLSCEPLLLTMNFLLLCDRTRFLEH